MPGKSWFGVNTWSAMEGRILREGKEHQGFTESSMRWVDFGQISISWQITKRRNFICLFRAPGGLIKYRASTEHWVVARTTNSMLLVANHWGKGYHVIYNQQGQIDRFEEAVDRANRRQREGRSDRWVDPNNALTILEYHPRTATACTTSRPRRKQENATNTTKTKISDATQCKLTD
jgi:hypothetical protein